jgi:DNA-binding transcriptional MocR family regulator
MVLARWNADVGTNVLAQAALASLLESGGLERHLKRMRKLYGERLRAMLRALAAHMPPGTQWTEPRGGHAIWLTLPAEADAEQVWRRALAQGVAVTRGDAFHFDGQGGDRLYLSFAAVPPGRLAEGIAQLADIVRRHAVRRRRVG